MNKYKTALVLGLIGSFAQVGIALYQLVFSKNYTSLFMGSIGLLAGIVSTVFVVDSCYLEVKRKQRRSCFNCKLAYQEKKCGILEVIEWNFHYGLPNFGCRLFEEKKLK